MDAKPALSWDWSHPKIVQANFESLGTELFVRVHPAGTAEGFLLYQLAYRPAETFCRDPAIRRFLLDRRS